MREAVAGAPDKSSFSSPEEISEFIDDLGFTPVLTNSTYSLNTTTQSKSVVTNQPPQDLQHILEITEAGQRIYAEQAIMLHDEAPFYELGRIANKRRRQVVGGSKGTFIIDRNISFTNVCVVKCKFCAFHKTPGNDGGFVMDIEGIVRRVKEAVDMGATQIMLQGGLILN